jgi:hypothetical protein
MNINKHMLCVICVICTISIIFFLLRKKKVKTQTVKNKSPQIISPLSNSRNSPLSNSPLSNSTLSNSPLSNSPLSNSPLSNSTLSNSTLSNSTLSNSTLSNSTLSNSPLSNSPLSNSPLSNSTLSNSPQNQTEIPKIIFQTFYNIELIPKKVYDNIKLFGGDYGYLHVIYDDDSGLKFLEKYFTENVILKFKELNGAHKADLFRYCVLYIYGGVYLDIKTELLRPVGEIFKFNYLYTALTEEKGKDLERVYQGIIASPPKNPIFLDLIKYVLNTSVASVQKNYNVFTTDFYDKLKIYIGDKPTYGLNKNNIYLLKENVTYDCDIKDRHGVCSVIEDNGNILINTRYTDYPWK